MQSCDNDGSPRPASSRLEHTRAYPSIPGYVRVVCNVGQAKSQMGRLNYDAASFKTAALSLQVDRALHPLHENAGQTIHFLRQIIKLATHRANFCELF